MGIVSGTDQLHEPIKTENLGLKSLRKKKNQQEFKFHLKLDEPA